MTESLDARVARQFSTWRRGARLAEPTRCWINLEPSSRCLRSQTRDSTIAIMGAFSFLQSHGLNMFAAANTSSGISCLRSQTWAETRIETRQSAFIILIYSHFFYGRWPYLRKQSNVCGRKHRPRCQQASSKMASRRANYILLFDKFAAANEPMTLRRAGSGTRIQR